MISSMMSSSVTRPSSSPYSSTTRRDAAGGSPGSTGAARAAACAAGTKYGSLSISSRSVLVEGAVAHQRHGACAGAGCRSRCRARRGRRPGACGGWSRCASMSASSSASRSMASICARGVIMSSTVIRLEVEEVDEDRLVLLRHEVAASSTSVRSSSDDSRCGAALSRLDAQQPQQRAGEEVDEPHRRVEQPQQRRRARSDIGSAMRSGYAAPITFGVISVKTRMKKVIASVASASASSLSPNSWIVMTPVERRPRRR